MNAIQTTKTKEPTTLELLEQSREQFAKVLPKHLSPDRMVRMSLTLFRMNPKLQKANPYSFIGAVMKCAELGLEPGSALNLIHLIPFENKRLHSIEVNVIIGYQGMIELALRSGRVKNIYAQVVHEKDRFEFTYGTKKDLLHVPYFGKDKGAIICFYAFAELEGGSHVFEVMSKDDVDLIRSKAKSDNIWSEHYEEMGRKTLIRRLFKYLPKSSEIQEIQHLEALHDDQRTQSLSNIANPALPATFETWDTVDIPGVIADENEKIETERKEDLVKRFNASLKELRDIGFKDAEILGKLHKKSFDEILSGDSGLIKDCLVVFETLVSK
jgi:recombination protein RecT